MVEKINPLIYITDHDPVPESVKDVSSWFFTETLELQFGESVGKPAGGKFLHRSMLGWFFAQGWYVDAVSASVEGGNWQSVNAVTTTSQSGTSASSSSHSSSSSEASSDTDAEADSSGSANGSVSTGGSSSSSFNTHGSQQGSGNSKSHGYSNGNGSQSGRGFSSTTVNGTSGGIPYWYSYSTYRLKRRRMRPESILKDMVDSYTKAYNEGRELNNDRYKELVSLYRIMLDRTETEINAVDSAGLQKKILNDLIGDLNDFRSDMKGLPANFGAAKLAEVNRQFDAMEAKEKARYVEAGMYGSTIWGSALSGMERDRAEALSKIKDETFSQNVEIRSKILGTGSDIAGKIQAAVNAALSPSEMRNNVFKWMLEFMERRTDDYPALDKVAEIAQNVGFAQGGTVVAPSS